MAGAEPSENKKTPGHAARALKLEACCNEVTYFVAGAAVAGAAEADAGVDLCDFFDFFDFLWVEVEAVEAEVAVVAELAAGAEADLAAAGLSSANAAPSERTATATRAESVFFI